VKTRVLVTGADGYLGSRLAARLLARGTPLCLWARASTEEERSRKTAALSARLGLPNREVELRFGDLSHDSPFDDVDRSSISAIVHGAAVTRFNVDSATAQSVNVDGAVKVFRFAERCENLERLLLLSTVYASGLAAGVIAEASLPDAGFANEYERSKWKAEAELVRGFDRLPWLTLRVATVLADNPAGEVTQHNAVHNTLQLLYYGFISTLPGSPATPVYLVTGDFVVDSITAALDRGEPRRVYHVAHRRDQSLRLGELVDLAFETFQEDPQFRRKSAIKPLYVDRGSFDLLRDALSGFAGGAVNQAIGSVAPFAAQLFIDKDVRNENLLSLLGGDPAGDAGALARETCRTLLRTRFGRQGDPRAA
jgi:nucleoside-diphosphate-sugar epimerase